MKIHEYQAKQILARYGVRIPRGEVAYTKEEARRSCRETRRNGRREGADSCRWRGKGGGVKAREDSAKRPSRLPSRCWA